MLRFVEPEKLKRIILVTTLFAGILAIWKFVPRDRRLLSQKRLSNNYLRIDRIHLDLKLTCYPSSLC